MVQNFNQIQYLRLKYANEKKKLEIINRNIHNLSHVSKVDDITDALRNLLFCDDEPESPKSEAFVNQTNGLTRGKAIKLNEAQQLLLQRYYTERERKMKTLKNLHMCCKQCNARTDQYEKALDYYNAELFWLQKMR